MAKGLQISTPTTGYERLMPFNRIAVERFDSLVLMHFGLVVPAGTLRDHYSCGILEVDLQAQKDSLMEYLGRAGALGEAPEPWQSPNDGKEIDVCNFIGVCGNSEVAEITLNNFVARAVSDLAALPKDKVVPSQAVALLRSGTRIHKHWIRMLFAP
jgi:hypothetical protein